MAKLLEDEGRQSEARWFQSTTRSPLSLPAPQTERRSNGEPQGIKALLTTKGSVASSKNSSKSAWADGEAGGGTRTEGWKILTVSRKHAGRLDQFEATIRRPTVPHGDFIFKRRNHDGAMSVRKFDNTKAEDKDQPFGNSAGWKTENPQQNLHSVTVGALIDRFMSECAPRRCRKLTQGTYRSLFENRIRPRWERELAAHVRTMAVEEWIESYPHSRQIKSHVRNLMHTLFQTALRWEIVERNLIDLVRQSRKRMKTSRTLTPAEFRALVAQLSGLYKTMVITVACLGLRGYEMLGLQWGDIDVDNLMVKI